MQIFINREGGQKKYSSVLSPGHHEGLGYAILLILSSLLLIIVSSFSRFTRNPYIFIFSYSV